MILLGTVPYLRRHDRFTMADRYGSWVAHQDLARAALEYGGVEGVHFYLPQAREIDRQDLEPALEELRRDFPGRPVEIRRLSDLQASAREVDYVLADDFELFSPLALARYDEGRCRFPVTTIVHTIPRQTAMLGYVNVLLLAEPFDAIVATSEACDLTLRAVFEEVRSFVAARIGAPVDRPVPVKRIPLAVDETFFQARDRLAARRALKLPDDGRLLLYVGRLSETFKADLEPLLLVCRRFFADAPDLQLVIAGQDAGGHYASAIRRLADEFGIGGAVTIATNFAHAEKPLWYAACDIFVSPVDNLQETFGLSILEAMASGLPVVASDWSGYRDLVRVGETGFLVRTTVNADAFHLVERVAPFSARADHYLAQQTVVDPDELHDAIAQLLNDAALRARFGACGRARVRDTFSWRTAMGHYRDLWHEQWEQLRHAGTREAWRAPLDLRRQFGHFATAFLDESMQFAASPHARSRDGHAGLEHATLPYPLDRATVVRVLDACLEHPSSARDLEGWRSDGTRDALAWLWKKGYVAPSGEGMGGGKL